MSEDEARVREVLADLASAYRSKDAERIVGDYAPDIVMFSLAPPLVQRHGVTAEIGGDRYVDTTTVEGVKTWLAGFGDAPFEYDTRDLEVAVGGGVAYAHCLARMGSSGVFGLWHRLTFGLRKRDGHWQIAHVHASVPFYMDEAGRAALDLAP